MKLNKADFLYQNDVRKEILRRADGMDKEDYAIVDELRDDLKSKLGIDTACFQDLRCYHGYEMYPHHRLLYSKI